MLKNILKVNGAQKLNKSEQKTINGGGLTAFGCASSCPPGCLNCMSSGSVSCGAGTNVQCNNGAPAGYNTCYVCFNNYK